MSLKSVTNAVKSTLAKTLSSGQRRCYATEPSQFLFRQLFDNATYTYTYLIGDRTSGQCALIDPVRELVDRDLKIMKQFDLKLKYSINTHVHADHITGSGLLKKIISQNKDNIVPKSILSRLSGGDCDIAADHKDILKIGDIELECRSTPGHTFGCMTFVLHKQRLVFTGDALLIRGCGRTDFQQGCPRTLYNSVHNEILSLPEDYRLYPGHDYTGQTMTTVMEEKHHNSRLLNGVDSFSTLMENLNLPPPSRLAVSLPANMKDGVME